MGTFKSTTSNSPCSACPANSMSSSTGATVCACVNRFTIEHLLMNPSDPCTSKCLLCLSCQIDVF